VDVQANDGAVEMHDINFTGDDNTDDNSNERVNNQERRKSFQANADGDILENEHINSQINPVLYVRGVKSEYFYLILSGKVMVCAGNEGFLMEQGSFNHMGSENLMNESYVPDFSAKVIGQAKLLQISRSDYRTKLANVYN